MQRGVTVALVTFCLLAMAVGAASSVSTLRPSHLTLDQYFPLPRSQHGARGIVNARRKDSKAEFDLSIDTRRPALKDESFRISPFLDEFGEILYPHDDTVSAKADSLSRILVSKYPNESSPELSSQDERAPSELEDPFVADDTFQDQGPGSVEIYKLDLFEDKSLLGPTLKPPLPPLPPSPPTRSKSKLPKKTGQASWKTKMTDYKSTSPKAHGKQSNSFTAKTEAPRTDAFDVGGVPELQVGCEGLEASSHKSKRSVAEEKFRKEKETENLEAEPWLHVTPVSLNDDYESSEEGYEEMDELVKLKRLQYTTKSARPNRGDIDATLNSDFFRPLTSEKLPVRGDLGQSGKTIDAAEKKTSSSANFTGDDKEYGGRAQNAAGRKLLWMEKVANDFGEESLRKKRSILWGFGEDEGAVSSNELRRDEDPRSRREYEERRRQEYERRREEEARRRSNELNRTKSEIDRIREEYEEMLRQREREMEEQRRRTEGQRTSMSPYGRDRWQEEQVRRQEEQLRRQEEQLRRQEKEDEEVRRRAHQRPRNWPSEEERRRSQEEEMRRREHARRQEEERRRHELQESRRNTNSYHPPSPRFDEERRREDEERRAREEEMRRREELRRMEERRRQEELERRRTNQSSRQGTPEQERRRPHDEEARREHMRRVEQERMRQEEEERRREAQRREEKLSIEDRRRMDERQREWMMKRRQEEEEERKRRERERGGPSNLMHPGDRVAYNRSGQSGGEDDRRLKEQREREEKLRDYMQRNRPIDVRTHGRPAEDNRRRMEEEHARRLAEENRRRIEEERRRHRVEPGSHPEEDATRPRESESEHRRRLEEHRRRMEEERRLQEYVRRNQPANVPSRRNESREQDWMEQRRILEAARNYDRSRYASPSTGGRAHGPSAPTYVEPRRGSSDESRRLEEVRRLEEHRQMLERQQQELEERRREAARREEEARRIQSQRYEEERKRLEAARATEERRRQKLIEEQRRRAEAERRTWPTASPTSGHQDPRRFEEQRRNQQTNLTPVNLVLNESKLHADRERQRQEQERHRLEAMRRRQQEEDRLKEQQKTHEKARLNNLPVSARIIIRSEGFSPPSRASLTSRSGFGNEINFPGINPHESGLQVARFPAAPTSRPPVASPSACVWAIVQCCPSNRNRLFSCFESLGCPGSNWDSDPCRGSFADAARDEIMKFYAAAEDSRN